VDGGALLVANHISWIDIPAVGALTTTAFVSKAEVRRWPLIGWLAAMSGTVFIERGCQQYPEVSARITGCARQGRRVVLFPEGTTTEGRSVRPFHPRLLAPAIEEALPVQPVALRYSDARGAIDATVPFIGTESFLHHLWRVLRQRGVRVEVTFCPALVPPHAARRRLADAAREAINETLYPLPTAHSEAVIELPALATEGA
jgi:1-acyl-sn-glycerol-3-phosphate acyltransferase